MILMEENLPGKALERSFSCISLAGVNKGPQNSGRVLVVEDEESLAEILEFNLQRNGFQVLIAKDGLEACRLIGREKPDLILLDIMLPLLNGWEICRMIRSHHDRLIGATPIIMLSALSSENDKLKGYDLGADLYLPKPYTVKEVILQARRLIERKREQKQLNAQLAAIRKWTELQDNWQQALFHELRNQLTVISGMADHLNESTSLPADHTGQFIEQISTSSHYLGSLAENYLLIRQVEDGAGQLQPETFLLTNLFKELEALFKPLAEQKSCELTFQCSVAGPINLHPVGLKIILASLLENALKYSLLDGHVMLSGATAAERLCLRISDDGPGIPAEDREQVFEKFYRGSRQAERTAGSGLGLYMARTLARAMGGSLVLEQQEGGGCCFILSFPAADKIA